MSEGTAAASWTLLDPPEYRGETEALYRLWIDQIIMALLITLAAMVLGLGFTLAALT